MRIPRIFRVAVVVLALCAAAGLAAKTPKTSGVQIQAAPAHGNEPERVVHCVVKDEAGLVLECNGVEFVAELHDVPYSPAFWFHASSAVVCCLVAGLMSGLTIGLLSFDLTTLQVLREGGEAKERIYAASLIPVIKHKHWLLVTLLLCNAAAMEALPLFLHQLMPTWLAVVVSVTAVLFFGEIIPQALCVRYGLAIGYYAAVPVRMLMYVCGIVSWPIGRLLDVMLGHEEGNFFRREELKVLVNLHAANEEEPLSDDEIKIIKSVLEMSTKTCGQAQTSLEDVYALNVNEVLDRRLLREIARVGHSRIPVYEGNKDNIIGMLLSKNLWSLGSKEVDDGISIRSLDMIQPPRVNEDFPLFDLLRLFKTGKSHLAIVHKPRGATFGPITGIITLEDIIEEMMGDEIYDESDVAAQEQLNRLAIASRHLAAPRSMLLKLKTNNTLRSGPLQLAIRRLGSAEPDRVISTQWQVQPSLPMSIHGQAPVKGNKPGIYWY